MAPYRRQIDLVWLALSFPTSVQTVIVECGVALPSPLWELQKMDRHRGGINST
jgi:hypothetical protein